MPSIYKLNIKLTNKPLRKALKPQKSAGYARAAVDQHPLPKALTPKDTLKIRGKMSAHVRQRHL